MKTNNQIITLISIVCFTVLVVSCTKLKSCKSATELTNKNHLVDIAPITQIPELYDTLVKYPQLQVYRVIDDTLMTAIHCNVFYKGLIVFSDQYSLFKSKSTNTITSLKSWILDTVDFSLTPTLPSSKAIEIAKEHQQFSKTCIQYRLGILDLNASQSFTTKDYKLVWKVQGSTGFPYVILDANNGTVYRDFDGVW